MYLQLSQTLSVISVSLSISLRLSFSFSQTLSLFLPLSVCLSVCLPLSLSLSLRYRPRGGLLILGMGPMLCVGWERVVSSLGRPPWNGSALWVALRRLVAILCVISSRSLLSSSTKCTTSKIMHGCSQAILQWFQHYRKCTNYNKTVKL